MRILSVFGTRPEAIKMAPVLKALDGVPSIEARVCVSAQHRGMLDQVLDLFDIRPDYDLDVMKDDQDLDHITNAVLAGVGGIIDEFKPHRVLVHGDTTTTFAAALAAYYRKVPVGHVEAGLRSGDIYAPFPEEMMRTLADAIADKHFAPTESARNNLLAAGAPEESIFVTGNTVIDALFHVAQRLKDDERLRQEQERRFAFLDAGRRLILVTCHRRENFGEGLRRICQALDRLGKRPDAELVYPVHLNPNVRKPVEAHLSATDNIHLIDPVEYPAFVFLMERAHFIITDSGGIQEEAPALGKPVLVMRDVTERPEALEAGTVKLVGTDAAAIAGAAEALLDDQAAYGAMSKAHNPYGDGKAARRIVEEIAGEAG